MGSASFVCAIQLRDYVSDLIEAIDLEALEEIPSKTALATREAEALEKELLAFFVKGKGKAACCILL